MAVKENTKSMKLNPSHDLDIPSSDCKINSLIFESPEPSITITGSSGPLSPKVVIVVEGSAAEFYATPIFQGDHLRVGSASSASSPLSIGGSNMG